MISKLENIDKLLEVGDVIYIKDRMIKQTFRFLEANIFNTHNEKIENVNPLHIDIISEIYDLLCSIFYENMGSIMLQYVPIFGSKVSRIKALYSLDDEDINKLVKYKVFKIHDNRMYFDLSEGNNFFNTLKEEMFNMYYEKISKRHCVCL